MKDSKFSFQFSARECFSFKPPVPDLDSIWNSLICRKSEILLAADLFPDLQRYMLTPKQPRIMTIIGILVPLAEVGAAATLEMSNAALTDATVEGGIAGRIGGILNPGRDGGEGGATTGEGTDEDPDAILPVSQGQPSINPGNNPPAGISTAPPPPAGDGTTPVAVKPQGQNPKISSPTFIGTVGWVAPGTMTSMSNSIWQESKASTNPQAKVLLNSQAVVDYLGNQSAVLTQYNNALLTNTDNVSISNMLSVLAGGSFIETTWSQAIFETALSADIISRQINTAWQSTSGMYISYLNRLGL